MTHDQELNLERFSKLMVELIEKHADAIENTNMNINNRLHEDEASNVRLAA